MPQINQNNCPICKVRTNKIITDDYGERIKVHCPHCGRFEITRTALISFNKNEESDWATKLSYWIKQNQSGERIVIELRMMQRIIKSVKFPSPAQKADNLLIYIGKNAKSAEEIVSETTFNLCPIIGAHNAAEVEYIANHLQEEGLIKHYGFAVVVQFPVKEIEPPPLKAQLTIKGWSRYEKLNSQSEKTREPLNNFDPMNKGEQFGASNIEHLLIKGESILIEFKGSFMLDIDRVIKGDGKENSNKQVAIEGVLKTVVAFLNSKGGSVAVGILEKDKFSEKQLSKVKGVDFKDYYLIGIELENSNPDKYELKIRDFISIYISKDLAGFIDVSFQEYFGLKLCLINVKAGKKWYYLEDKRFIVRDGNRSVELSGENMDNYKNRHIRR